MTAQLATQCAAVALCLGLYYFAFREDAVGPSQTWAAVLLLSVAAPLGYDTLNYRTLIEEEALGYYGPLWAGLGVVGSTLGWATVYVLVYAVLVAGLARFARCTRWPSLCFAILATAPGLGLEFLSIMRQGLATGFVILAFCSVRERQLRWSALWSLLGVLAHPAAVFPLAYVYIARSEVQLRRRIALGLALASVGGAAVALSPETFERMQVAGAFMWSRYISGDSVIENESGRKLFIFWILMLVLPVIVERLLSPALRGEEPLTSTRYVVGSLIMYGLLLAVSGSSARLAWFFLPFCVPGITDRLASVRRRHGALVPVIYATVFFVATAYWISLSEGYFWAGQYDHPTYLPGE